MKRAAAGPTYVRVRVRLRVGVRARVRVRSGADLYALDVLHRYDHVVGLQHPPHLQPYVMEAATVCNASLSSLK